MKFPFFNKLISFLLIAMTIGAIEIGVTAEIPGYIGEQSFHLSEQEESEDFISAIKKINNEGARAGQSDGTMDGADLSAQLKTSVYPGDFNGPNYKPKIYHAQSVMIKAFADGYIYNYRKYARIEFQRRIDTDL